MEIGEAAAVYVPRLAAHGEAGTETTTGSYERHVMEVKTQMKLSMKRETEYSANKKGSLTKPWPSSR